MQAVFDVVQDRSGNAVAGAYVAVYTSSNVLATLYSDNGVTPLVNPTITNFDGEYFFYAPNGTYRIEISATGYAGQSIPGVVLYDPADGFSTGSITYTGTLTGGTGVVDIGSGQFYKDTAGRVGIGLVPLAATGGNGGTLQIGNPTTSSGAGITIGATTTADIQFSDGTSGADQYAGLIRYSHVANALSFWTASAERVRIDQNGNVGIGTSSPAAKLHLFDSAAPEARLQIGTNTSQGAFSFYSGSIKDASIGFVPNTSILELNSGRSAAWGGKITFVTDTSERMRIDQNGNVGIGTVSPSAKFEVYQDGNNVLRVGAGATGIAGFNFNGNAGTYNTTSFLVQQSGTRVAQLVNLSSNPLLFGTSGNEVARFDASGRFGVGTTSISALIEGWYTSTAPSLSSSAGAAFSLRGSSTLRVNIGSDPATPFGGWIQSSNDAGSAFPLNLNPLGGNVGIGTTSPVTKFDVVGADGQGVQFRTGTRTVGIGQVSSEAALYWGSGTALTFFSGLERMRLDPSGNLGLGVTPSAWGSGWKAVELVGGSVASSVATQMRVYQNAFFNGTNTVYKTANPASLYLQDSGGHYWSYAPSGAAGANISFVQAMVLNASGNLGLGVTPSAWGAAYTVFEVRNSGNAIWSPAANDLKLTTNVVHNGTNYTYAATAVAGRYEQNTGRHIFLVAPSGTAGSAITFTEASRLTEAGNQIDYQPAESAQNTSVTLTVANLQARIITSNAAVTLTLPTGTTLEGYTTSMAVNTAFDVTFIATTANAITIAANGNTTVGNLTVSGNTSGTFRFRKTATNTFTVYRIS